MHISILRYKELSSIIVLQIFLFYLLLFLDQVELHINDDLALHWLLQGGYAGTLILSYPLSYLLNYLYEVLPSIQWQSLLYTLVLFTNFIILSYEFSKTHNFIQRMFLYAFLTIIFIYICTNISITILTILTLSSAIGILKKNSPYFIFLLSLALLLRFDIILFYLPFLLIGTLLLNINVVKHFKTSNILLVLLIILINLYLPKYDKNYSDWFQFNKARGIFHDFKANTNNTSFSSEEKMFLMGWWIQDDQVLPSKNILDNKVNLSDRIFQLTSNISFIKIKNLLKHKYRLYFLLLLCVTLIIIYKNFSPRTVLLWVSFILGFFLVILLRDVDRTTIPLLIMWFLIVTKANKGYITTPFYVINLCIVAYYFFPNINLQADNTMDKIKHDGITLLRDSKIACEPSIGFPQEFSNTNIILSRNILFKEDNWAGVKDNILPAGWLSRHEFFYETHQISSKERKRKFNSYYDFLLDPNTGFIGSKKLNTGIYYTTILSTYDKFLTNKKCHHDISIIKESKYFAISQFVIKCPKEGKNDSF